MPPRVPHGKHGWEDHSLSVLPVISNFLVLFLTLALVLTGLYLWRTGRLPLGISAERGRQRRTPSAFSPNASPAGTSQLMSSWSGLAC
jgi:hypothetical protein